jgi:hypothetical protein
MLVIHLWSGRDSSGYKTSTTVTVGGAFVLSLNFQYFNEDLRLNFSGNGFGRPHKNGVGAAGSQAEE